MPQDSPYKNKAVLVTGASGFIGAALAKQLVQRGAKVTGTFHKSVPDNSDITWKNVNLADLEQASTLLNEFEPDIVFHLAGSTNGERNVSAVIPTLDNNLIATVNLLVAAANSEKRPRIVLAGSMEEPDPEDSWPVASSPYAASKFAATSYARAFYNSQDLSVSIARIFMVYGPGQKDKNKLMPYVIKSLLCGRAPELTSGTRKIDWIYISDLVDGLISLGETDEFAGSTIELGSGEFHSIRDTVLTTADIIDCGIKPLFGAKTDRPLEQERRANVQRTYEQLGWKPTTSLEQGIRQTVIWMKEQLDTEN